MRVTKRAVGMALLTVMLAGSAACGKKSRSSRDTRREQLRIHAESKRQELAGIDGEYFGRLAQGEAVGQSVTLNLQVKDVPTTEEGEVDPVLVPTLSGFMNFNFTSGTLSEAESISFALDKADYDGRSRFLNLNAANSQYKNIVLALDRDAEGTLRGDWTAPDQSATGTVELLRSKASGGSAQLTDYPGHAIRGEYGGILRWRDDKAYETARLTISTSLAPPDALQISASIRVFSDDFTTVNRTYVFSHAEYKPITGEITLKAEESEAVFSGRLSEGKLVGQWSTSTSGEKGDFEFTRDLNPEAPDGLGQVQGIQGEYIGILQWDALSAYQQCSITLTSTYDPERGLLVSGVAKLTFGESASNEYLTYQFPNVTYNPSTRAITIRDDANDVSFTGELRDGSLMGKWSSRSVGLMGDMNLKHELPVPAPDGRSIMGALAGAYSGRLVNRPGSNLPEQITATFTTHRDNSKPNGIDMSGTIRFYFDDTVYDDHPMTDISFNFFTRELTGVTTRWPKLTLKAKIAGDRLTGKLYDDALGEAADVDLSK